MHTVFPLNTKRSANSGLILVHTPGHWTSIKTTLAERLVFAWLQRFKKDLYGIINYFGNVLIYLNN